MNLHRYQCRECKTKILLPEFKDCWRMICPACGEEGSMVYDKPINLLTAKGKTSRKVRFITLYNGDEMEFYLDGPSNEFGSVKDVFSGKLTSPIKNIQHFGVKSE